MKEEVDDYQLAQQYWDERFGDLKQQKRRWQYGNAALIGILGLCVYGLIHEGSMAKTTVIPVVVNGATGATRTADAASGDMDSKVWNLVKKHDFETLVAQWRTVTTDTTLRKRYWDETFEQFQYGSKAALDIGAWFAQNNPDVRASQETVSVDIESSGPVTEHTYEVWWTETTYRGSQESQRKMQGVFTYRILGYPTSKNNGFGILVTEYSLPLGDDAK